MKRTQRRPFPIVAHRGYWTLRPRVRIILNREEKIIQRAIRLCPVDEGHPTKDCQRVQDLASQKLSELGLLDKQSARLAVSTLAAFVEPVYLKWVREHRRPSTADGYEKVWHGCLAPRREIRDAWMAEVRTSHIEEWLVDIARERHYTENTMKHVRNLLSGIFTFAIAKGYLDRNTVNPVQNVELPNFVPKAEDQRAYSLEEIALMLRVLDGVPRTAVATAAFAGLRGCEQRGASWSDYRPAPDENSLRLLYVSHNVWRGHVGEPKTRKSKNPVPVIPQLEQILDEHRKSFGNPAGGWIFQNSRGNPLDLDALYRREMKHVLRRAGIDWCGWHAFRRGLGSNLNRLGVDDSVIQAILRHSNIAVTQTYYIKTTRPDADAAMRKFSIELSDILTRSARSPLCSPGDEGDGQAVLQ